MKKISELKKKTKPKVLDPQCCTIVMILYVLHSLNHLPIIPLKLHRAAKVAHQIIELIGTFPCCSV